MRLPLRCVLHGSQTGCDVVSKRFDVVPHSCFGDIGIASPDCVQNGRVLLLNIPVMARRSEGDEPEAQRSFMKFPEDIGEHSVSGGPGDCKVKLAIEQHHLLYIARLRRPCGPCEDFSHRLNI
jgi:hypothetical protein